MVAYFEEVAAAVGDAKQAMNRLSDLVLRRSERTQGGDRPVPGHGPEVRRLPKATAGIPQQDRRDVFKHVLEHGVGRRRGDGRTSGSSRPPTSTRGPCGRRSRTPSRPTRRPWTTSRRARRRPPTAIKGHVMKSNKGAPNDVVQKLLDEELAKV